MREFDQYGKEISETAREATYVHHQTVMSDSWVIDHGLGKFPTPTVKLSSGNIVLTRWDYQSPDRLTVYLGSPDTGTVYLN